MKSSFFCWRIAWVGVALALAVAVAPAVAGAVEEAVPPEWLTPAEIANFESTPSYVETIAFLERVEKASPAVKIVYYGNSGAGRAMPLVVVSKERVFSPTGLKASPKPVILILNGIHAGEIDGKDACLMLLRDLALGRRAELLDAATLLIVPIYNVDGHERVSPWNRPNQDGPRLGMGFRTTADGHDLNRDFLKLETPEARALMRQVNAWKPALVVDDHVTDGSDHDWVVTYAVPEAPQLAAPVAAWMAEHLPRVVAATESAGHRAGPYVELEDPLDPSQGFTTPAFAPRYSSGYFPLRQRPTVLVEMHSHKPYRQRVLANRDFLAALVAEAGRFGRELQSAEASAALATVLAGEAGAAPSEMALDYAAEATGDRIRFPVYDWYREPSIVSGEEILRFRRGAVRETEVAWIHAPKARASVPRPRGYLLMPGWPEIEQRLVDHDLRFERLTAPIETEVETMRVDQPAWSDGPAQGQTRVTARVTRALERRRLPAGAIWIPANQPCFAVAAALLEPGAPDSLFQWGYLSNVFERKEWIGESELEDEAKRLVADPTIAAAWKQALADPGFAADHRARYLWWFERTPYRDSDLGLLPYFRVLKPLPR
ncbi:MAG: M14 family metallopeptidase [Thermoanaerobaculia bacterium]